MVPSGVLGPFSGTVPSSPSSRMDAGAPLSPGTQRGVANIYPALLPRCSPTAPNTRRATCGATAAPRGTSLLRAELTARRDGAEGSGRGSAPSAGGEGKGETRPRQSHSEKGRRAAAPLLLAGIRAKHLLPALSSRSCEEAGARPATGAQQGQSGHICIPKPCVTPDPSTTGCCCGSIVCLQAEPWTCGCSHHDGMQQHLRPSPVTNEGERTPRNHTGLWVTLGSGCSAQRSGTTVQHGPVGIPGASQGSAFCCASIVGKRRGTGGMTKDLAQGGRWKARRHAGLSSPGRRGGAAQSRAELAAPARRSPHCARSARAAQIGSSNAQQKCSRGAAAWAAGTRQNPT